MKKSIYIEILDEDDKLINSIALNEVPLYEDYILATSKDEYNNDEPCVIIRTCIRNNIYKGFTKYLKDIDKKLEGKILVKDLPNEYKVSMDWGVNATCIIYKRK